MEEREAVQRRLLTALRDQHVAAISQLDLIGTVLWGTVTTNGHQAAVERIAEEAEAISHIAVPRAQIEAAKTQRGRSAPHSLPPLGMTVEIYAQQREGDFTSSELVKDLCARGYRRGSVSTTLSTLVKSGHLTRVEPMSTGKGFVYRLAAPGAAPPVKAAKPAVAEPVVLKEGPWPIIEAYARQVKEFNYQDIRKDLASKLPTKTLENIHGTLWNYTKKGSLTKANKNGAITFRLAGAGASKKNMSRASAKGPKQSTLVLEWAHRMGFESFTPDQVFRGLKSHPRFRGYSRTQVKNRLDDFVAKDHLLERPEAGVYRIITAQPVVQEAAQEAAAG